MVENAFVTDQCTKFIFLLCVFIVLFFFYLIRTQAFSVFSEVSCCVPTPPWDRTIRKCQTVWTKETACGWPLCSFFVRTFIFYRFLGSLQPSPLWSHCHSFFSPPLRLTSWLASVPLTQGGFWIWSVEVFQCFLSALQQLFYPHKQKDEWIPRLLRH